MYSTSVLGATIALGCLAGCAGYDGTEARYDSAAADVEAARETPEAAAVGVTPGTDVDDIGATPETDPEPYRISVEIPVDDVTIDRGENLDVDALLDERTSFAAADFHLREVILVARSRRGGSAELIVDEWASGVVDIPHGDAESWYEVRIPAPDVGEGGTDWVVDFSGALDLNLLVVVLEPRVGMLAAATATVREVAVDDTAADPGAVVEVVPAEVVQTVELVEPGAEVQTIVNEVTVERPVYRTSTVYRYVDRPIYSYRVSWIYDPARYYVFRDYYGWTYRYFPGTWDWRCYDLSFRLPRHHHHHRDRHRHRADRHDGRRFDRRDGDRRGDRDRRRDDRDGRDRRDRDRDRRGDRHQDNEARAIVSRPSAFRRRVDSAHARARIASQRDVEPRGRDLVDTARGRPGNPRLRTSQRNEQPTNRARAGSRQGSANPRPNPFQRRDSGVAASSRETTASRPERVEGGRADAANNPTVTVTNARPRSFERREVRQGDHRTTSAARPQRRSQHRPPVATPATTSQTRQEHSPYPRVQTYQRRPEQLEPTRTGAARERIARPPQPVSSGGSRAREESRPSNARTRVSQRETDSRTLRSGSRPAEPRRTPRYRTTAPSNATERPSVDTTRSNARTRTFQRQAAPRVVEPTRPRTVPSRPQTQPRASAPVRSVPPRQATSQPRPQRATPTRNTSRPAPQRERPVQRPPAQPKSDSGSDARSEEGRRSNARTRTFERR